MIQAELSWDDEAVEHIWEGHHLSIEEVNEGFHGPEALIHTGRGGRQLIYGQTEGGRYLIIVVEFESRRKAWLVTVRGT